MADRFFGAADPVVVILHYGDPAVTARLYRQLAGTKAAPADPRGRWQDRILVLDNASPQPWPAGQHLWTRLPDNRYWAGALAWTLETLRIQGRTHVWFLNNDLWFTPEAGVLDKAWQRLQALETRSGQAIGASSPAVIRHPYHPQMVQDPARQFRRVHFLDGVAPLLRLEAVQAIGGLDWEDNPRGYGVDLWLSLRLHRAGWPLMVDHQVAIRHEHHTAARQEPAFLPRAADQEDAYLRARLGADWRAVIQDLANASMDVDDTRIPDLD
ncbi:glycosyltransferase family protein [Megalodesulfovibrio paquesii]